VGLAFAMASTVFIISAAYSRIIEEFPHGGGGYVVATKLLGERAGVVSGSALLVDYVLTITVSIAAAGDALFSFAPLAWHVAKLPIEVGFIGFLTVLNLRGVRESVLALSPVFLLFIVTHIVLIGGSVLLRAPDLPQTAGEVRSGFHDGLGLLGAAGLLLLFVHAFSLGGGTYTGIEAVSNGLPIMREPRVQTARRTMLYMSVSLAFTATGLLLCYLLWQLAPVEGKTMNAVLAERVAAGKPLGGTFVLATLISEGALLVVAAQAGFIDGPRVLANMAVDSWLPRRFSALSDRLTTQNGILLMGGAALAALLYTRGMSISWLRSQHERPHRRRRAALFVVGFVLCAGILAVTISEKFSEGGWVTMAVTGSLVLLCFVVRRHYRDVGGALSKLYAELENLPPEPEVAAGAALAEVDPNCPTAAVLVASYGGLGIHTAVNIFATFPGHFRNIVFLSVGVIDSGAFKGEDAVKSLASDTEATLQRYVDLASRLGVPSTYRFALGTDAVQEAEALCLAVKREFPRTTFFAGKVIFRQERWFQRVLHNETAFAIQKRLQFAGQTMVILPARVT